MQGGRDKIIDMLGALAQQARLDILALLAKNVPDGLAAGKIARALEIPHNTMSTHLAILQRAGLLASTRCGRIVTYRLQEGSVLPMLDALEQACPHIFVSSVGQARTDSQPDVKREGDNAPKA